MAITAGAESTPPRRRLLSWTLLLGLAVLLAVPFMTNPADLSVRFGVSLAAVQDLVVCAIAVVHHRRVSIPAAIAALGIQILAATYYVSGSDDFATTTAFLVLLVIVAWLAGQAIRQQRERSRAERDHLMTEAITAERLRIARELHDMVAHSIGVIAFQAGMGRRVIETRPAQARDALDVIEATSRDTLSGLRRVLGALRQADAESPPGGTQRDPTPTLRDLGTLITTTADAGVQVDVEFEGRRRDLDPYVEASAFRIVQEALTNVVRHAGTRTCRVVVDYQEETLLIEIVDDGRRQARPGTGYGIVGMRERAAMAGGRLDAGPRPEGGYRVVAVLPIPADAG